MKLSISNTGRNVTICVDPEMLAYLNHTLRPAKLNKFTFSYKDGQVYVRPWTSGTRGRTFVPANPKSRIQMVVYLSKDFEGGLPTFGKIQYTPSDFVSSEPNTYAIELPSSPPAAEPRVKILRNGIRNRTRPGAVPGKFAGWRSEETRRRSLEGLAKARAKALANRKRRALKAATSTVKEILSDQPTLRAIGQASLNGSPAPQPTTNGMANLTLQVGNKTVNYQVPEDELYEYAFELSEKGYRLK